MKPHLLFADEDRSYPEPGAESSDLERDLGIATIVQAMAAGDEYLHDVASRVLLSAPLTPEEATYRLDVLEDCLRAPDAVRELYELARAASDAKRRVRAWMPTNHPAAILRASVSILRDLAGYLRRLHIFAREHHDEFSSRAFTTLLETFERDLDDEYLTEVQGYLGQLQFDRGVVLTANLGPGCTGIDYRLREAAPSTWWERLTDALPKQRSYTYHLPPRDENGGRTLDRIRDHGINTVANAAAQSTDHVLEFFRRLSFEVGFYVASANLDGTLHEIGVATCRPTVEPPAAQALSTQGLVDVGLALRTRRAPVGSDIDADGKALVMVTGANQGGKSTLIRALGLAQLMVDAGMFVAAQTLRASTSTGVLTHYRREEDAGLKHGKFDDELQRMSHLVDRLQPGMVLLLDESFASTNEREGSQIASEIVDSLVEAGMRVCYVTHLYTLSHGLAKKHDPKYLFLRAQPDPDGRKQYRIIPAEPESTSYAIDQFRQVFAEPLRS